MRSVAHNVNVYSVKEIFEHLKICIRDDKPFSLIRLGDGGLKMIHSFIYDDKEQLDIIIKKEGLEPKIIKKVLQLWGYYGKRADYIDTPEVYFSPYFWPRIRAKQKAMKPYTVNRMRMWNSLYHKIHIHSKKFCNPEFNFLSCLRLPNQKTLINLIEDKKICLICDCPNVAKKLPADVTTVKIVSQYEDHYKNSYPKVIRFVEKNAKKFDLFLVAAGELGRIYSGRIREFGGRSLDIGFIVEYWSKGNIPIRLQHFIQPNPDNPLEFILTKAGKKYERYL